VCQDPGEGNVANETLVQTIKEIIAVAKGGDTDGANARYASLFSSREFASYRPEDQRQALKLILLAKHAGDPSPSLVETHRAALAPLAALTAEHGEAADFEMLGICQVVTGDEANASASFRAGLERERATDPDSDLCGRLMKRLSAI
jgi:hypothetical protein